MEHENRVTLKDGRRLAYRVFGEATGAPVFFFHGTPGSRFVLGEEDALSGAAGIRFILPERPGYGASDAQAERTLLGWAEDVRELAAYLGLRRYAVSGISGGGPHALACAAALPDAVTCALLLASATPVATPSVSRPFVQRLTMSITRRAPWLLAMLLNSYAKIVHKSPDTFLDLVARSLGASDRTLMASPDLRASLIRDAAEAYAQGAAGHLADAKVLNRDWRIDLAAIQGPVHLWHGEDDQLVDMAAARRLVAMLPHCRSSFLPGVGHLLTEQVDVVREWRAAIFAHA